MRAPACGALAWPRRFGHSAIQFQRQGVGRSMQRWSSSSAMRLCASPRPQGRWAVGFAAHGASAGALGHQLKNPLIHQWGITPPSSGRPKAGFAHFVPPLMSNVRPFMSGALVIARPWRSAAGAIQEHGLPVRWRSAHRRWCAIEAASSTKAASGRVAAVAPPPGGAGRACASAGPLSVALLSSGSATLALSAHLHVVSNAWWCGGVAGPCGEALALG